MAYYDENGKITIDEVVAQQDILKLQKALELLNNTNKSLNTLLQTSAQNKGETANAIHEKATELLKQNMAMQNRIKETIEFIKSVLISYKRKDEELKNAVQTIGTIAGDFGKSGGGGHSF